VGFEFSQRFRVLGYFNYYRQEYDLETDFTQDYDGPEFGTGFQMRLMPKTWGFIRYFYGQRDYSTHPVGTGSNEQNDADFDWHRVNVGLTWDPKAKFKGELNFGYRWMEYENARDINGDFYEEKDTWVASSEVSYLATESTTLTARVLRAVRFTGSTTKEYYEDTGIGFELKQGIFSKFLIKAGAGYNNHDYNLPINNPREDDLYKATIGLNYKIREWLNTGVGYVYTKRDSNRRINDYKDNQVIFSVHAVY
jgi:hypothetical protein